MMKRWLALAMACALALTGCGKEEAPSPAPETPPSVTQPAVPEVSASPELERLRADITQSGALVGVAYLGSVELPGFADVSIYLEANGFGDKHPFLYDIPEEHLVRQEGCEIFAVVPASPDVRLTIREYVMNDELTDGAPGDVLLSIPDGAPVLLIGTATELISNLYIQAEDSTGLRVDYVPCPIAENWYLNPGEGVYDFTSTELLGQFGPGNGHAWWLALCDTWYTRFYNGDGEEMALTLSLMPDGRAEYSYGYPNSEILERFEGSWSVPEDQQLMLELHGGPQSSQGSTTSGESYPLTSFLHYEFYGNTLVLNHESASPLLAGAQSAQFSFLPFDGFDLVGDWNAVSDYWGWIYTLRLFDNGECWFDIYSDSDELLTSYEGWWSVNHGVLDLSMFLSCGQHPENPELDSIWGSYLVSLSGSDELMLEFKSGHILTVNMEGEYCEYFHRQPEAPSTAPISVHYAQDISADLSECDWVIVDDTEPVDAVFCTMVPVEDFKVVSLLMQDDLSFDVTDLYEYGTLEPERPLCVTLTDYGTIPSYGVSFTDPNGMYRVYGVTISGRDGSLELAQINETKVS